MQARPAKPWKGDRNPGETPCSSSVAPTGAEAKWHGAPRLTPWARVYRSCGAKTQEGEQKVPPGTEIVAGDKPVGAITSSVYSLGLRRNIALGYLRREHAEAGKQVMAGTVPAEVAALPFSILP